jgi:hypothetical protein
MRSTSRADAFYTFKTSYPVVVHALRCLQNQGDDKVGQFLASIMQFQFIIALVVAKYILHSTVYRSTFLRMRPSWSHQRIQDRDWNVKSWMTGRIGLGVWDELYQPALNLAKPFDISESMPRRSAVLTHGHAGQLPGVPTRIGAQC